MTTTSLEREIEAALIARVLAGAFPTKSYPSGVPTLGANLAPQRVVATPLRAKFGPDPTQRLSTFQHARTEWIWIVEAEWSDRVELQHFEDDDLNVSPVVIRKDSNKGIVQQAELQLKEARYVQPAQGEPPLAVTALTKFAPGLVGTYALWTFSATLTPHASA